MIWYWECDHIKAMVGKRKNWRRDFTVFSLDRGGCGCDSASLTMDPEVRAALEKLVVEHNKAQPKSEEGEK